MLQGILCKLHQHQPSDEVRFRAVGREPFLRALLLQQDQLLAIPRAPSHLPIGVLIGFPFISYQNARKRGNFCIFLLKIAEKEGKTDLISEPRRDEGLVVNLPGNILAEVANQGSADLIVVVLFPVMTGRSIRVN